MILEAYRWPAGSSEMAAACNDLPTNSKRKRDGGRKEKLAASAIIILQAPTNEAMAGSTLFPPCVCVASKHMHACVLMRQCYHYYRHLSNFYEMIISCDQS